MRTITRYVIWELLKVFFGFLALATLVMLLLLVGNEARRMNLGLGPTLRLVQFILPQALAFAVPAAILFSVCFVYGRMSADNEVTAIKSLGISPLAVLWPGFVLAFVVSLFGVWLNDVGFSWGHAGTQRVVLQSVEEIAYRLLRAQGSYSNSKFSILVRGIEDRRLILPTMTFQPNNDVPAFTLYAQEAELQSDYSRNTLRLILTNFRIESGGKVTVRHSGTKVQEIPLSYASAREARSESPSHLPLSRITAATESQVQHIEQLHDSMAAEAGISLFTGDFAGLSEEVWRGKRKELQDARTRLARLQTEPWRRWAGGFSCLFFVLIGAPLAIRMRSADYLTTFAICFGPILAVYYPLFMMCLDKAKEGGLPPYFVWAANLICGAIGLWFGRWVLRH